MGDILIQYNDIKSKKISSASLNFDKKIVPLGNSSVLTPFYLINHIIRKGKPDAVIYRYLNDYPQFYKSIIRFLSEVLGLFLIKVFNINLIWMCHNVDRETKEYYPKLTYLRRKLFCKLCYKILVTDQELIKKAQQIFPSYKHKLDYFTFGSLIGNDFNEKHSYETDMLTKKVEHFVRLNKKKHNFSRNLLFCLCVGSANWKTVSYERLINLINKAEEIGYIIRPIVVGPLSDYYNDINEELVINLKKDGRILFVDKYVPIDERDLSDLVHFYWRVYKDWSVPVTIYHAASLNKPMLTENIGFLGQAVSTYSLGYVLNENYTNLKQALEGVVNWEVDNSNDFLITHNWEEAAKRIIQASKSL